MSLFDLANNKNIEEVYLRFISAFILLLPGMYITIIAIKTKLGYFDCKWQDIAHFEDQEWWKDENE